MKVKLRRVRWSWLRIFCENRAGLCRVIGGQALKRPWKEQKSLFVQNTVSKAQGTVKTRRLSVNERTGSPLGQRLVTRQHFERLQRETGNTLS